MLLAQEAALKACSKKTCKRTHTTAFQQCPACREYYRKRKRRLKREAAEKKVPDGQKLCTKCSNFRPVDQFISKRPRRKKLTSLCLRCREVQQRSHENPTTTTGRCLQVLQKWRDERVCAWCGDARHTEADHCSGLKVNNCGEWMWWACHGGVKALSLELAKCQPLCRFCHRLKSV